MSTALAFSALLMGLAGGPHCAAMCGPACTAITRVVRVVPRGAANADADSGARWGAIAAFQAGRLASYSVAGALAAFAVQNFASLASTTSALKPLWTLFHLAVLAWGLMLVALARQPLWVSDAGRSIWSRVRPMAAARGGVFAGGLLWALMPCGLLYSALLVASLSGGPVEGALAMALFALGSGLSLSLAPAVYAKLLRTGNQLRQDWGTRAAGALLVIAALWALWMDMAHSIAVWCGIA